MAEVLLFHHALGLTPGVQAFADSLRQGGHTVHTPDLFDGRTFDDVKAGVGHAQEIGSEEVMARADRVASTLPASVVYAGFSLGVLSAQQLAQTREGAAGAVLMESCVPATEFGERWPAGVPVQVHGLDGDEFFVGDGDIDHARAIVAEADRGELVLYPGDGHLFADPGSSSYDADASALMLERVLEFLDSVG
ncbi:MAG: dienelactone hydrolase family protein [Nocardioides sp.]